MSLNNPNALQEFYGGSLEDIDAAGLVPEVALDRADKERNSLAERQSDIDTRVLPTSVVVPLGSAASYYALYE